MLLVIYLLLESIELCIRVLLIAERVEVVMSSQSKNDVIHKKSPIINFLDSVPIIISLLFLSVDGNTAHRYT